MQPPNGVTGWNPPQIASIVVDVYRVTPSHREIETAFLKTIRNAKISMEKTTPHSPALLDVLNRLTGGDVTVDEAASLIALAQPNSADANRIADGLLQIDGATVDLGRQQRCGFGEVIYGEGKSSELIVNVIRAQLDAGQSSLVTRIDPTTASQVRRSFDHTLHNPVARTLRVASEPIAASEPVPADELDQTFHVAVVTAGSTDLPAAEEAAETLGWMGIRIQRYDDIGVAGPQRLLASAGALRQANAVVVVAGMEGALPASVGGHVPCPVFAVPTSIGYGTNLGGLTPLMGMLCSCAPNVAVVNVDAGFKGGYLAGLVTHQLIQVAESVSTSVSEPSS